MSVIYVTSLTKGAGKTAFSVGLASLLKERGKSVGYIKPVVAFPETIPENYVDDDAAFARQSLALAEPIAVIAPSAAMSKSLAGGLGEEVTTTVKKRWVDLSKGKDVVIVEGLPATGETANASKELATLADAKAVLVISYSRAISIDQIAAAKTLFGDRFLGVVLNNVPEISLRVAREETAPALIAQGIRVLALIPEDRLLLSLTVADYSHLLGGKVVNNDQNITELVEHVLIGANVMDSSEYYYERKSNKALITRFDRPDLQWNALGDKTKCLILTGGKEPIPYVLDRAVETGVPVMIVPKGTLETLTSMESFVTKATFHYPKKLARYKQLLSANSDVAALGV